MGAMIEITTITGVYVVRAGGVSRGDIRRDEQHARVLRYAARGSCKAEDPSAYDPHWRQGSAVVSPNPRWQ